MILGKNAFKRDMANFKERLCGGGAVGSSASLYGPLLTQHGAFHESTGPAFSLPLARRGIFSVPKWEFGAIMYVNKCTPLYIYRIMTTTVYVQHS